MNDDHKTHYRKAFDSPYLSAADIVDPIVLTIKEVKLKKDQTAKTKDDFNTCYWVETHIRPGEPLKPMILNATNSKFLAGLTGSKWIDDWAGHSVTVYVDGNVRFGKETVEGLRLAKAAQRPAPPAELVQAAEAAADEGLAAYAAWFKRTTAANRTLLGTQRHDAMKKRAAAADQQRSTQTEGAES